VFGRCEDTTGIVPFGRLVEQVMTTEPYASARRVFWIVDNGSSHRGQTSVDHLEGPWPTLRLIDLPVHASWLDQAEIYFSIVQRKVVNPNDFRYRPDRRAARGLRSPLQRGGRTVRLAVRARRPRQARGAHRRPPSRITLDTAGRIRSAGDHSRGGPLAA
jgi:hypothetical protein